MEEFVHKANSGSFKKGYKPWNKGTKGVTGRRNGKGHQGFQPRPVIALNPDGTICKKFPSVKAAQEYFGLRDRHSIILACQQKFFCRGYRLLYEEDYVPWADYHNKRPRSRDIYGRLLNGHHNVGFRKPSAEKMRELSKRSSELSKRMCADPNNLWGKSKGKKPVMVVETGKIYPSIKDCALDLNIPHNQISLAIKRNGTVHGYTIRMIKSSNTEIT